MIFNDTQIKEQLSKMQAEIRAIYSILNELKTDLKSNLTSSQEIKAEVSK